MKRSEYHSYKHSRNNYNKPDIKPERATRREKQRVCLEFSKNLSSKYTFWWKSITDDQKWEVISRWDNFSTNVYVYWSSIYTPPSTKVDDANRFSSWLEQIVTEVKPPLEKLRDTKLEDILS